MSPSPLNGTKPKLPEPTAAALAHQQKLCRWLKQQAPMPFADFMQTVLYHPGLGYYSAGSEKLGTSGDFVTAPMISPLFSQALARQCQDIFQSLPTRCIVEFGAGTGVMAGEITRFLDNDIEHYYILEVSADLRQRQQQFIQSQYPECVNKITWLDTLPVDFVGVVLANEVLDAMPVHRFEIGEPLLEEWAVFENEKWQSRYVPTKNSELKNTVTALQQQYQLPVGYQSEVNLQLNPWLKSLDNALKQGVVLLIDYGFTAREFYHPDRQMGTLMCHYRHFAHPDPYLYIGLQDITAHVDFTAIAEADVFEVLGFTQQAAFLLNNGLLDLAQTVDNPLKASRDIQLLTQAHEMGELFKVMALGKAFDADLQGFAEFDQSHRL